MDIRSRFENFNCTLIDFDLQPPSMFPAISNLQQASWYILALLAPVHSKVFFGAETVDITVPIAKHMLTVNVGGSRIFFAMFEGYYCIAGCWR